MAWSGWGMQWGDGCANANVAVTAGDAGSVTSSSLTPGCADVVGCMDANASNYNADATVQGYDQMVTYNVYMHRVMIYQSTDVFMQMDSEHSMNSLMLLLVQLTEELLVKRSL